MYNELNGFRVKGEDILFLLSSTIFPTQPSIQFTPLQSTHKPFPIVTKTHHRHKITPGSVTENSVSSLTSGVPHPVPVSVPPTPSVVTRVRSSFGLPISLLPTRRVDIKYRIRHKRSSSRNPFLSTLSLLGDHL